MSEMSIANVSNNGVNEAGVYNESLSDSRCPMVRTRWLGRHQATVRKKWSTQDNIFVMTCYYQNQPGLRGYRQGLLAFWKEKGLFEVGEQRLCDQVRMIQRKDCSLLVPCSSSDACMLLFNANFSACKLIID